MEQLLIVFFIFFNSKVMLIVYRLDCTPKENFFRVQVVGNPNHWIWMQSIRYEPHHGCTEWTVSYPNGVHHAWTAHLRPAPTIWTSIMNAIDCITLGPPNTPGFHSQWTASPMDPPPPFELVVK
jgi:hypothetical protein